LNSPICPDLLRSYDFLREDLDPNYKLLATRGIFVYGAYSGDFMLIDEVIRYTESAFYTPGASALNRAWYAARLGFALRYVRGSREKARAWFLKAREIVHEHGLRFIEAPIAIYWAWTEEVFGEIGDIQRELGIAEAHLDPASRFEAAFRQMGIAFVLARQNDLGAAVAHMRETFSFFQQSGYTLGQVVACLGLTGMRLSGNDFSGARDALDHALRLFFPGELRSYADGMFSAGIALGVMDEERAKIELRWALALGAEHGLENTLSEHFLRRTTAALCAYALKHGIETYYVKRIIHAQHLAAPSSERDEWLWPVRVHALGIREQLRERAKLIRQEHHSSSLAEPIPKARAQPKAGSSYSGKTKIAFCDRLGDDWKRLADCLEILVSDQARFERGDENRSIWVWLENRSRLADLPEALQSIGRKDLAELLETSP
jgi:hypothetical protein